MVDSNKPKKLATVNTILKNIFLHSENSSKEVDEELFLEVKVVPTVLDYHRCIERKSLLGVGVNIITVHYLMN